MTNVTPEMFPKYKATMHTSESEADIERIGDYNEDTHVEHMRLAAWRWNRISYMTLNMVPPHEVEDLKELGELTYSVRHSATFRALLKKISQRRPGSSSKLVDKIGKVARFFRSSVTFTEAHSLLSHELTRFNLECVRSRQESNTVLSSRTLQHLRVRMASSSWKLDRHTHDAKRLLRRWRKYVVHAEILLLLFYEEHPEIRLVQDYIGISKRSCYLCANFIRLHKRFVIEGEHQQLYCLWTLPECIYLRSDTQKVNFIAALTELSSLVEEKVTAICQSPHHTLPFNVESVANFSRTSLVARRRILPQVAARNRQHSKDTTKAGRLVMQEVSPEDSKAPSPKADNFHNLELSPEHIEYSLIEGPQDNAGQQRIPLRSHPLRRRHRHRKRKFRNSGVPAHRSTVRKSNAAFRRSNQPIRKLLYTTSPCRNRVASPTVEREETALGCLWIFSILFSCGLGGRKRHKMSPAYS
jgi:hypothetical protein